MDVSPWQFPLDTIGLYWMVLASAETWSAEIKYLEPKWPLFLKVNPTKQGPFKPKQGAPFGFQVPMVFCWTWFTKILSQQLDSHSVVVFGDFSSKPSFQGSCWFSFRVYECSLSICTTYSERLMKEQKTYPVDWYEVNEVRGPLDGHDMALLWESFTNSSLFQGFFGKLHFPSNRQFSRVLYKRDIYKGFSLPNMVQTFLNKLGWLVPREGRFATAFMNPLCHCSPRKYMSSTSDRWQRSFEEAPHMGENKRNTSWAGYEHWWLR